MDFNQTKQEKLFLQMIREFAEKEIKPLAAEIDEEERFPAEAEGNKRAGENTLRRMVMPKARLRAFREGLAA